MIKTRDEQAEAASERLLDEHASPATRRQAERELKEAGNAEARWFATKVELCLKTPELLE